MTNKLKILSGLFQLKIYSQIKRFSVLSIASLVVISSVSAFASEIRLRDCEGTVRASTEMEEGQTKGIKILVSDEESTVKAKLSKNDSAAVLETSVKDKSLVFSSVGSGDWKVCKQDGSALAFNSVEFIESPSESLRMASLVAGGAAILSGIAIASDDSGSSSNSDSIGIAQPNQPDRSESEKPLSALKPGSSSRPEGEVIVASRCGEKKPTTLAAVNDDCREDEDAPVISPFN